MPTRYDVIVIGGGHAGCEAALVSSRMGMNTLMVTLNKKSVARMSCNPSVGGIGKSHLVCELSGLGGELPINTDYTGIQFRTLNTRKGPAVQAFRVQCDKNLYSSRMLSVLENTKNLIIIEDVVATIVINNGTAIGIQTKNNHYFGNSIVLTTGTFLNGTIRIGSKSYPAGRFGELSYSDLSDSLARNGIRLNRFKTGTPPRIKKESINYAKMECQPGDILPNFFSRTARIDNKMFHVEHVCPDISWKLKMFHVEQFAELMRPWTPGTDQLSCYLTHTNQCVHDCVRRNLHASSMYGGYITSTGVRYCPSLEDKVVKFPDRPAHHVFIEPEGRLSDVVYPNGISNSLPEHIQDEFIRFIPGLENAIISRCGYAIEYDYADPTQLDHTMQCKIIKNLFFAGQINGTTGYEEAAAQGFVAGVNAVLKCRGEQALIIGREDGYIGVLIDDLVTKGVDEPYRMFTSRSEHRLTLRQDNAEYRMLEYAKRIGIINKTHIDDIQSIQQQVENELKRLKTIRFQDTSLIQLLKRPGFRYYDLPYREDLSEEAIQQVEVSAKYDGFIEREHQHIQKLKSLENIQIPEFFDFGSIVSMRYESRIKLDRIKPRTLGQASRIPGVNPADISILLVAIKYSERKTGTKL